MRSNSLSGRRVVALTFACALAASACGGPATTAGPTPIPTQVVPTSAPATPTPEPVTIQVLHWGPGGTEYWDANVAAFETAYPWITVEQEIVPFDQYFQKVATYLAAEEGPDVMLAQGGQSMLQWKDGLLPLTDHVDDIRDQVVGWYGTSEGFDPSKTPYGIPLTLQGHPYYSHTGVLSAAGVDPTRPPADWNELGAVCDKVIASGKQCFLTGGGANGFTLMIWSLLQQTATTDQARGMIDGTTTFEDPPLKDAIRLLAYMFEKGWIDRRVLDLDMDQAVERFAQGDGAYVLGLIGDAYNFAVYETVMAPEDFGTLLLPPINRDVPIPGISVSPEATTLNAGVGQAVTVTAWSDAVEAALLFAKYLASPEVQSRIASVAGSFPASSSVDPNALASPHFRTIVELASKARTTPAFMLRPNAAPPAIFAQMQLILLGEATVDSAAAEIQRIIESAQ